MQFVRRKLRWHLAFVWVFFFFERERERRRGVSFLSARTENLVCGACIRLNVHVNVNIHWLRGREGESECRGLLVYWFTSSSSSGRSLDTHTFAVGTASVLSRESIPFPSHLCFHPNAGRPDAGLAFCMAETFPFTEKILIISEMAQAERPSDRPNWGRRCQLGLLAGQLCEC